MILVGPALRAADRLAALLDDVLEIAEGTGTEERDTEHLAPDTRHRPTLLRLVPVVLKAMRRELHHGSPILRHAIRVAVVAVAGYSSAPPCRSGTATGRRGSPPSW
ncbi:FUSC family protein OS=Streptomyces microflavus OX=1919 GN=HUT09_15050 PE=4 SV=1 [Streptomyces microflavus]